MKRLRIAAAACALLAPAAAVAETAPVAAIDPARLAAARVTVDYVFPTGTYARLMNQTMNGVMKQLMDSMGSMPLRDLAGAKGISEDKLSQLGDGTLKEIMTIYDPHYEQRMQLTTEAMFAEMSQLMTQLEPAMRDGLTRAYAKRFTADELGEMNRFFATPTGKAYAADSMIVFMDPDVIAKITEFMPAMIKQMPAMTEKLKEATAKLPPPRKLEDLTPAERDRLAKLLGMSSDELGQSQDDGLVNVK
jgi:hypothetical protein